MTLTPRYSLDVQWDVEQCVEYFESQSDSVADRFRDAVAKTVRMLCDNPEMGELLRSDLTGQIRRRTILGFGNYLIFYRRVDTTLEIVRVIHGAMDGEPF